MDSVTVTTHSREEFIDITTLIRQAAEASGIMNGLCTVFVPHTTAGVTINEHADPAVKSDILMAFRNIVPDSLPFTHAEGNSPAHVKASLMGSSVSVLIENSRLVLGTWQGIFFCEFDGPRNRRVHITCRE